MTKITVHVEVPLPSGSIRCYSESSTEARPVPALVKRCMSEVLQQVKEDDAAGAFAGRYKFEPKILKVA